MINGPKRRDALLAAAAGAAAVAGSYLATGWTPSFVVRPVDQAIVNLTPGPVVTFAIATFGDAGHLIHIGMAVAAVAGLFGAVAFAGLRVAARTERRATAAAAAGGGAWLLAAALTGVSIGALGAALPAAAVAGVGWLPPSADGPASPSPSDSAPDDASDRERIAADGSRLPAGVDAVRRRTLGVVAGALGFVVAAAGGRRLSAAGDDPLPDAPRSEGAAVRLQELDAAGLAFESDDLHDMVSPIGEFYNVDIAEFDPEVTAAEWSLTFTGETETDRTVTFDELVDRPVEHRAITLRCVGEDLNGRKLDNAVWTGTPIRPLIESVDPQGECDCAMLRGEDGYYVQFPVDVLAEGFLAWGMNGKELPSGHGHPVRVLIPGHWGETNVKWLSEIELLSVEDDGYWEERGWEGTGEVKTVAKLWDEGITELGDGRVELAGHAYAGTRGVERVEVSTDGGDSWTDAALSDALPDADVWRQWRHVFEPDGEHEVVVRATDGTGTLQSGEESGSVPSGASGWVRRTVG
ncbi:molybdopterin-dependent oxidoreductase [Halorubrum ezzemoulense]|uniref:molybdopterin-dependent oxidoreductase n=3 Tax=Halorubrum ezzemoulense TaxID=337243 RepID=UPI00232E1586|nr:molybdopterin-dependent oxidoreductase [Halorubrum ezzemoulense]MDB9248872.1 molybdopterin-dependent oxidoreductase [Halorubrum ezzemoulense]MDB9258790.1 molybdopterin-dependent oxidoreductase [Halorubrum ezzemoulense]MDB9262631.1 molybdopterin-dependent oxidoreductase [Halorubrum ezzemoulense]MDB9265809.1 molybdopterin-dependent oxidoreductase [Halorubrum ezzemoulense]MDB9269151.1 molybdopterin-dependent oxidoreductase [Halorubrum ezzemoulense]